MAKCLSRASCGVFFVQEVCFGTLGAYFGSLNCKYTFWTPFLIHFWVSKCGPWSPFGEQKSVSEAYFCETGEHEQTLVYTVFAPHYGPQGAPILAPKASQRRPEWSKVVTEACKSVWHDAAERMCTKSDKKGASGADHFKSKCCVYQYLLGVQRGVRLCALPIF